MSTIAWKLRYAPHLGLVSTDAPLFKESAAFSSPWEQVRYAAELGFAGVEDNHLKRRTPEDQCRLGEALARHGLEMGSFVGSDASRSIPAWRWTEPESQEVLRKELRASIEAAKRVNGRIVTTFAMRDPRVPFGFQLARMIEGLRPIAEDAARAGIVLALEAINARRNPDVLLHRLSDAFLAVKALASPAVKLIFDCVHVQVMEGDLITNFKRVQDEVVLVQAADNPGRCEPGSGEINFVNLFKCLQRCGYVGLVELEHELSIAGREGEQLALARLRAIDAAV